MLLRFFKCIGLLVVLVVISTNISASERTPPYIDDKVVIHPNFVEKMDFIDHLSTLPREILWLIFENFDDAALSCTTTVSKKYRHLKGFTESIFYQRSDFKDVLSLPFPDGSPWKHSYFLRKGFWDLLMDYRKHYHKRINYDEREKIERFAGYCDMHDFIVSNLAHHLSELHLPESLKSKVLCIDSKEMLSHLTKFNTNLNWEIFNQGRNGKTSNNELIALEVATVLNILGIEKDDLKIEPGPLIEFESSFDYYKNLYQQRPNIFKTIIQKSIVNPDKAMFISDLIQYQNQDFTNFINVLNFYDMTITGNSPSIQRQIGLIYSRGYQIIQDYVKAYTWCLKAANQGNAAAQNDIGIMYYNGYGVTQNYTESFAWCLKAANQGSAEAQHNIGDKYYYGHGVVQSYTESFKWYRKAADQGDASVLNIIGCIYEYGRGVTQDDRQALAWYRKAANKDNLFAQFNVGNLYYFSKTECKNTIKAEEIFENLFEVLDLTKNKLDAREHQVLGMLYSGCLEKRRDLSKAFFHFEKAAQDEYSFAQVYLGRLYKEGQGIIQDYTQALHWIQKSSNENNLLGQYNLALMYLNGEGVAQDDAKAFKLFRLSADQGGDNAQYFMGWMYEHGRGINIDLTEAQRWYQKANRRSPRDALYSLGRSYAQGLGVEQDMSKAMDYYRQAAALDDLNAKEQLRFLNMQQ
ncbi:MAG: tetratricopeptide repeat protein [Janthinobacterium lividum]